MDGQVLAAPVPPLKWVGFPGGFPYLRGPSPRLAALQCAIPCGRCGATAIRRNPLPAVCPVVFSATGSPPSRLRKRIGNSGVRAGHPDGCLPAQLRVYPRNPFAAPGDPDGMGRAQPPGQPGVRNRRPTRDRGSATPLFLVDAGAANRLASYRRLRSALGPSGQGRPASLNRRPKHASAWAAPSMGRPPPALHFISAQRGG